MQKVLGWRPPFENYWEGKVVLKPYNLCMVLGDWLGWRESRAPPHKCTSMKQVEGKPDFVALQKVKAMAAPPG